MNNENLVDFYKLLQLDKSASTAEIEAACLRLGTSLREELKSDPENNAAKEKFKLLEDAFETLTSSESRSAYDENLTTFEVSKSLDAILKNTGSDSIGHETTPPPNRREGILVMAAATSAAAIVIVSSIIKTGPHDLMLTISATNFRFFQLSDFSYLIEIPASLFLLFFFFVFLYGLMVFLTVLPRPSVLWRRLHELWLQ